MPTSTKNILYLYINIEQYFKTFMIFIFILC